MSTQHDKPKRWRPRFSVRTLVIVVTLVCSYAACWGPTKRQGVEDVAKCLVSKRHIPSGADPGFVEQAKRSFREYILAHASPHAPMVIVIDDESMVIDGIDPRESWHRYYYFWFFGYVAKLPFEREI
jgi:hypothetical protein